MNDFVEIYRQVIVQIATPSSTGTGFYLRQPGLIVTNHHVVEGNRAVVVEGAGLSKQLARVCYIDPKYDLAFLEGPKTDVQLPDVELELQNTIKEGDPVLAIGHPFGLKYSVKGGIVSNTREVLNGIPYLHIDVALNPGNSGGPLVSQLGRVVGINTFVIQNGDNTGFSLPVKFLKDALDDFGKTESGNAARCSACLNVVTEKNVEREFCAHCGNKVELPQSVEEFVPSGVPKTMEALIEKIGHNVALSRCGPNAWEVRSGSAKIMITYHEKTGLISADAILCELPKENIKPLYEYLLRENYSNEALTLSVHEQDVILSLLIFDRYLDEKTGMAQLSLLLDKADYYDNLLVEQFGANWKVEI
ncbi:MAG: trypsin-like peptidase domain-containing protein [Bacteroidetes bacterium]|nr:trypsin-like peptidase domain-containing protein [Bacteroidota bacterium]